MPLNKTDGEPIPELGPHVVVPVENYSREPAFHEAKKQAKIAFERAGARSKVQFGPDDVIAQIHPDVKPWPKLVFLFRCKTRGGIVNREDMDDERFYHYAFDIRQVYHEAGHA